MAIAEAEPKKSEVAVTSAGVSDGMKEKALNAGKSFADNKGYASSSTSASVGTVKRYNLYDSIKTFRFEMPDGWNDEDIGLFVTCCWEKKDDFVKSNGDRTKIWADIAQSGAKQSRNPSLFTINSCLALAERIRYYVSKNSSMLVDNEAFMKFHSDVKGLLPHFSDNFDAKKAIENKCIQRRVKSKSESEYTSELLNNDSGLGDVIQKLVLENAEAIRSGSRTVWTDMSNKLEQHLGLNTDVKTILETEKNKIISSVAKMEEKGIDKKTAFIECARGFIEVFDYINPKKIKVSDYFQSSVGSTVDSITQGKDKSTCKMKRPNHDSLSENSSVSKNVSSCDIEYEDDNEEASQEGKKMKRSRIVKGRKTRRKVIANKLDSDTEDVNDNQEVVVEPSSTTSFDELPERLESTNEKEKKRKYSVSDEDMEKSIGKKNTSKNSRSWKEEKVSPRRIMPPRVARSKVISYALTRRSSATKEISCSVRNRGIVGRTESSSKQSLQQSHPPSADNVAKTSPNFTAFDTDSEEAAIDFTERFRRTRGSRSTSLATTNVTNPDTTTKDPDDKTTDNDSSFVKRANRKRIINRKLDLSSKQEELGSKVRVVNTDCAMKNLVVKLVDCNGTIDSPSHANIKIEKNNPFSGRIRPDRSKDVRLIEESAVLAKDVVDSEYNPSSDSAKLVSGEHLNSGHFSGLRNDTKRVAEPAVMPMLAANFMDSNQLTKHHVPPFFKFTEPKNDGLIASADSSEDLGSVGPVKTTLFRNSKEVQDNSVSSPYRASDGSSSLDVNQTPSTSGGSVNSTTSELVLERTLATLKKCRKEGLSPQDSALCVSTSEVFENNQFLMRIQDAPVPEWFGAFVADFRKHEHWKIQQLFKLQQEITDTEHRKIMLLEEILKSLK